MLKDTFDKTLLVEWRENIRTPDCRRAFNYLVGHGATSAIWRCHPQMKGHLPDFRYYEASAGGSWYFSFVPAQKWLLFYFRPPSITSGKYSVDDLAKSVAVEVEEKSGEWRVRVHNERQAINLADYIDACY